MPDPRYRADVASIPAAELGPKLRAAMQELERQFPDAGIVLFVVGFAGSKDKGLGYISNARREDAVAVVDAWSKKQKTEWN